MRLDYRQIRPLLIEPDADLTKPIRVKVITNTYAGPHGRAPEGIIELRGGMCPWYDKCAHCNLPLYSAGKPVAASDLNLQIDSALAQLLASENGAKARVLSMFNGGSGLNPGEVPKKSLFYMLARMKKLYEEGLLPYLRKISVESRETFVKQPLIDEIVAAASPLRFEVALGYESHNDAIRNGDADNSRGMIGLNKGIKQSVFEEAVMIIAQAGAEAKFYVMLGTVPWLVGEQKARDVAETVYYLLNLTSGNNIPLAIHLNPTYAAKHSKLHDVWAEAVSHGARLPSYRDMLDSLLMIEEVTGKKIGIGADDIHVYLGLDSESMEDPRLNFGWDDADGTLQRAFTDFNRTQDLAPLEDILRGK